VIVTKRKDGTLVIAAWNLVDPEDNGGPSKMKFEFRNVPGNAEVSIEQVDNEHGNVLPKYAAMGSPLDPTEAQVEQLNQKTALGQPERVRLDNGQLELNPERNALLLIQLKSH
jgi:xylan 1,4-beta-xylosidase